MKANKMYTAETIKCRPINMTKLNSDINKHFHTKEKTGDNITYHTIGKIAIITEPKMAIIDDEFIGSDISGKEPIEFNVWVEEKMADGGVCGQCIPMFNVKIPYTDLTNNYLLPEITLAEFAKGRRGYNSRIRANESDWMAHFSK